MAPQKAPSSRHRWPAPAGSHQDVDGGRFLGDRGESGAGAVRIRGYHIRIHRFPPDSRTATARAALCASSATRLSTRESVRESTPVDSGGPLNAPSETSLVSQGTQTLPQKLRQHEPHSSPTFRWSDRPIWGSTRAHTPGCPRQAQARYPWCSWSVWAGSITESQILVFFTVLEFFRPLAREMS